MPRNNKQFTKARQQPFDGLHVIQLFDSPNGPTTVASVYGRKNRRVWLVAAISYKQAIWLAANGVWYTITNPLGIVEMTDDGNVGPWHDWRFTSRSQPKYKGGQHLAWVVGNPLEDPEQKLTPPTTYTQRKHNG